MPNPFRGLRRLRNDSNDCDSDTELALPIQNEFMAKDILPSNSPPPGTTCGICLEECNASNNAEAAQEVVYLAPCLHFFHRGCIMPWFNSTRAERERCPICRRRLFEANPLTDEQINRISIESMLEAAIEVLHDDRPVGPYTAPAADEEIVLWEHHTLDMLTREAIEREYDRVATTGTEHDWFAVCDQIWADYTEQAGAPLRECYIPFQPVLAGVLGGLFLQMWSFHNRDDGQFPPGMASFSGYFNALTETIGEENSGHIFHQFWFHGLFDTEFIRVSTVPLVVTEQLEEDRLLSADLLNAWYESVRDPGPAAAPANPGPIRRLWNRLVRWPSAMRPDR